MNEASLLNWMNVSAHLSERQTLVFDALCALKEGTSKDIAIQLGVPLHIVTPRITELFRLGKVKNKGIVSIGNTSYTLWLPNE